MIKTPLSTVIGGAFWTPGATIVAATSEQLIEKLFSNGEQGFWYDPNDLSTMYQDAAGAVPVTTVGQPVGLIRDKSGRNNHAYQDTSSSRPILRQNATTGAYYLEFDGSNDFLQTDNIDFTATDKVSLFAGVRKLSDAASALCFELGDGSSSALNAFALFAPSGSGVIKYDLRNTVTTTAANTTDVRFNAPNSAVLTGFITPNDVNKVSLSINREAAIKSQTGRSGNFSSAPMYIGRRGGTSLPFNGHIYGLVAIGRLTTTEETKNVEKELAKRLGVTLSV